MKLRQSNENAYQALFYAISGQALEPNLLTHLPSFGKAIYVITLTLEAEGFSSASPNLMNMEIKRYPLPPFTYETALQKVQALIK